MSVLADVLIIIFLFFLFGLLHSYLATDKFKLFIAKKYAHYIAFYRMTYNIFSFITFYIIFKISPKPDVIIYDLMYPFDIIIFILQCV